MHYYLAKERAIKIGSALNIAFLHSEHYGPSRIAFHAIFFREK